MEITTKEYSVKYDAQTATIHWQGAMRLSDKEYEPIKQLLNKVAALELPQITLDLRKLQALNSSGITTLGKFILSLNDKKTTQLLIQASKKIAWQKRSVVNFKRLMRRHLQVEWE
ncbi:MAG: hypothetical protein DRR08_24655 [Candidatus Parabeggiatoa sp. nov. 2]|nr:MAG: hypothetical protein B6247_15695 [Beggiatoa sp. 4572_84]RKZ55313.1 MAG: hypothetical protein DRR08_24655 [Gammaproteobacteria bacterium]